MTNEPRPPAEFEPPECEVADRLTLARPIPLAGFRGTLGRHLAEQDPGYGPRPAHLRLIVSSYLGAGGVLIALVALGLS